MKPNAVTKPREIISKLPDCIPGLKKKKGGSFGLRQTHPFQLAV